MANELTVSYQYTKQDIINFVLDSFSFEIFSSKLVNVFFISSMIPTPSTCPDTI